MLVLSPLSSDSNFPTDAMPSAMRTASARQLLSNRRFDSVDTALRMALIAALGAIAGGLLLVRFFG